MTVQLHIEEHGEPTSRPSVVFTHGWIDDSQVWNGVIDELQGDAHCVRWDLRAHGSSEAPPPGNYTRENSLADLSSVVERTDGPVVLAGHSLGGYLSLAWTLQHPDLVAGLVLIAAGPGFRKDEAREQWNEAVDASAAKFDVPPGSEEISKHVDSWVLDELGSITAPTLVIVGEHDKRFAASASVFSKYLDVRSSVVVPDAGHSVHRKHGVPVAAAMRSFLAELD